MWLVIGTNAAHRVGVTPGSVAGDVRRQMNRLAAAAVLFSALVLAPEASARVVITEVQPNPNGADAAEWVEIQNIGTGAVDISGWVLYEFAGTNPGPRWAFPSSTTIQPGQVIVVTAQAASFAQRSAVEWGLYVPDFEMALFSNDSTTVPNMDPVLGANSFTMDDPADAVILEDAMGNYVDGVEYGVDNAAVVGAPVRFWPAQTMFNEGIVVQRVADGAMSSATDFTVTAMSEPGIGYIPGVGTPPMVFSPRREPAEFVYGETVTLTATIADSDGVASGTFFVATATDRTGAADGDYVPLTTMRVGNLHLVTGTVNSLAGALTFPEPTSFHERYLRWWIEGRDQLGAVQVLPPDATREASNAHFFWENVLPTNTVFSIAEAREQDGSEVPLWLGHAVRVEGIATTTLDVFTQVSTEMYLADPNGVEAIRVIDNTLGSVAPQEGDRVRVTGRIGLDVNGMRHIGEDTRMGQTEFRGIDVRIEILGSGHPLPIQTVSIATLLADPEQYESQLVEIPNVEMADAPNGDPPPANWVSGQNAYVTDGTDRMIIRVYAATDLVGQPVPDMPFAIRGIFGEFRVGGPPQYQVQPRATTDILPPGDGTRDGGVGGRDGGAGRDAGVTIPRDGGDSTPVRDGGVGGGAGGRSEEDGGCGCAATERREAAGTAMAFTLLALFVLRRRRRRPAGQRRRSASRRGGPRVCGPADRRRHRVVPAGRVAIQAALMDRCVQIYLICPTTTTTASDRAGTGTPSVGIHADPPAAAPLAS